MSERTTGMTTYPEHEKLREVKRETQAICEFMEWLGRKKGYELVDCHDNSVSERPEQLVAEFYEIDLQEFSNEKDRMVEEMRRINEPHLDPKA